MSELHTFLETINERKYEDKTQVVGAVRQALETAGYRIVDQADDKPWGAYFRIDGAQADIFIADFFVGLSVDEARLGIPDAELSPKILLVEPMQRLSWQYHDRRAERWEFLTAGSYMRSNDDTEGEVVAAEAGDMVQFGRGERHRLIGEYLGYTVVAEIWQHSDPTNPSDEDDIVRLADDYKR